MHHDLKRADKCAAVFCGLFLSTAFVGLAADAFASAKVPNSRPDRDLDAGFEDLIPAPLKSQLRSLVTPHHSPTPATTSKPPARHHDAPAKHTPKRQPGKHRRTGVGRPEGDQRHHDGDQGDQGDDATPKGVLSGLLPGRIAHPAIELHSIGRGHVTLKLRVPQAVTRALLDLSADRKGSHRLTRR